MRQDLIERIRREKIIAIIRGIYGDDCVKLANLLVEKGIHIMEVTFDLRSNDHSNTLDAIKRIENEVKGSVVGAGTVVSVELLNKAIETGACFIVSPDFNEEVIKQTIENGLVSIPGAATPTEIMSCMRAGADFVKIFPAANLGVGYIKAIRSPLSQVELVAVGGINESNVEDFLKIGVVGVGVGCVADKKLISENRWDELELKIENLVSKVNQTGGCWGEKS